MAGSKNKIFWLVLLIDIALLIGWLTLSFLTWRQVSLASSLKNLDWGQTRVELSELKRFLSLSEDKIAVINSLVITSDNVDSLVDQILDSGQRSGVVAVIDRAEVVGGQLELNISAKGGFRQSVQFLRLIEKLPYRLVVNKESLTDMSETGGDVFKAASTAPATVWRSEINLKILSYRP